MSDFTSLMSNKSDLDLVTIIHYKHEEYNNEAMDAAFKALKSRKLTELQISELIDKAEVYSQLPVFADKPEKEVLTFPDLTEAEKSRVKRSALLVSILLPVSFLIYFVLCILNNLDDSSIYFWKTKFIENYIILALLPVGIFGLLNRKKFGWFIINVICIYVTLTILGAIYIDAVWFKMIKFYSVLIVFPISFFLLYNDLIWTYFKISNKTLRITMGVGLFLFIVFWAYILSYF